MQYIPTDAFETGQFPLERGGAYRGLALPELGIVISWKEDDPPEFPIVIDQPDPADIPWPLGDDYADFNQPVENE